MYILETLALGSVCLFACFLLSSTHFISLWWKLLQHIDFLLCIHLPCPNPLLHSVVLLLSKTLAISLLRYRCVIGHTIFNLEIWAFMDKIRLETERSDPLHLAHFEDALISYVLLDFWSCSNIISLWCQDLQFVLYCWATLT